jgi:hypothetical protein
MIELTCHYSGDREQAIVSYLYEDWDSAERVDFERHLATCARCRTELAGLKSARGDLRAWAPPPLSSIVNRSGLQASTPRVESAFSRELHAPNSRPWRHTIPVWAQAAAAILLVGVALGAANVEVRYNSAGLTLRTGWSRQAEPPAAVSTAAPWRADLTALEERLRAESKDVRPAEAAPVSASNAANAEVLRKVRALLEESERRQQRELALRVAEVLRDVSAERQSDLARIDRTMGAFQNTAGIEMMRQRETINNLLVRTSLQK